MSLNSPPSSAATTTRVAALASTLFALVGIALFWALTNTIDKGIGVAFAYAAGVVLAITPCCLPLFFIITSLALKEKQTKKSVLVAVSFGLGFALIALSLGVLLATTGQVLGLAQVSGIVFAIGGGIGYT